MKAKRFIVVSFSVALAFAIIISVLTVVKTQAIYTSPILRYVAPTGVDEGDCTNPITPCRVIQYAIERANNGDEIRIASGVYTDINDYGGLSQIVYLSKSLTIRGGYTITNWTTPSPDMTPSILNASGQGRVIYITGVITPYIEGLYITGGNATGLGGFPNPTPWNSTAGGGIYIISATTTISNSTIVNNIAGDQNTSNYNCGGGVFVYNAPITIVNNDIISNTAGDDDGNGGGIILWNSDNSIIHGNYIARNVASQGGGILLWYNSISNTISNNTIISNTAAGGGGVRLQGMSAANIISNVFSYNTSGDGGGLSVCDGSIQINILDNELSYNIAGNNGGGANIGCGSNLPRIVFSKNKVTHNFAGNMGGGIEMNACNSTGGDFLVNANYIISNSVTSAGGGIGLQCVGGLISNNIIAQNNTVNSDGTGGIYIHEATNIHLVHNTIASNSNVGVYVTNPQGVGGQAIFTNTILVSHTTGIHIAYEGSAKLNSTLWGNSIDWNIQPDGNIIHTNDFWGEADFVNPNLGDYHITSASTAINNGILSNIFTDIDGDIRPDSIAPDLGADEKSLASPTTITITGPTTGFISFPYTFTAQVNSTATTPITYTWEATDMTPVTRTTGTMDILTLTWAAPGTKIITVTATNISGVTVSTYIITIEINKPKGIYLPLVLKSFGS